MRIRTLISSSLVIAMSLALATGCKPEPPGGTTPPEGGGGAATDGGDGGDGGAAAGDGGGEEGGDGGAAAGGGGGDDLLAKAIATECPAEVGDTPSSVFSDAVLIRLPKGVGSFVEDRPGFAYMNPKPSASVTCVEGVPEATITNGLTGYFEDDQKKDTKTFAAETLESLGYKGATIKDEKSGGKADRRTYSAVLDVPEGDGMPPAMAFFVMKSAHGRMHYVVWETHPDAWNALKATFMESANKMLLLNPGG